MGDYNIDINVNMGGAGGNFQSLIQAINTLNTNFAKVGTSAAEAGAKSKQSFAGANVTVDKYGQSVKKLGANVSDLRNRIAQQDEALKKGIITQKQHKSEVDRLNQSLKNAVQRQTQYNSALGQTAARSKTAQTSIQSLTASFNKLGAVMGISFGLYGVFRVLKNGVKAITEFELAQKKLRSILGETEEGMRGVSQGAIALGRASIFGAKGVTELQIILAKMGFVKEDILNMQRAIVNLATATQEDLQSSAEVVANIIRSYRMSSTETARVVDVIGKAFNTSALSLDNFRESIKYVAPVAKQAGFSIEETAAALAILSNAGIKGSLAGTGLNNVLKAMMDSNSKLSKYLGGTVKGFEGFISVLQKAKDEGWDMEMIYGLITQRATAAFSIMKNGVGDIKEFTDELLKASGTIEEQQRVQMESLAYQSKLFVEQFKAAWIDADESTNMFMQTLKGFVTFGQILFITDKQKDGSVKNLEAIQAKAADLYDFIQENNLGDEMRRQVQESVNGFDEYINGLNNKSDFWFRKNQAEIDNRIEESNQIHTKLIDSQAEKSLAFFRLYLTQDESSQKAYDRFVDNISGQMRWLDKASIQYQIYARAIELATDAFNEMTGISPTGTEDDGIAKLRKKLELEKQIAIESVKLKYNGDEQKRKISQTTFYYDKKIAEETLSVEEGKNEAISLAELKLANDLKGIRTKSSLDALKIEQSRNETLLQGLGDGFEKEQALMKSNYEYGLKILEQTEKGNENIKEKIADYNEKYFLKVEDAERKHAIEVLKIQDELNQLNIQISFEGYEETIKSREAAMKSEIDILVERNLATDEHNKEYEKIVLKYKAFVVKDEIYFQKELTQLVYDGEILRGEIDGNSLNIRRQAIDKWFAFESSKLDKTAVNYKKALDNLVSEKELKFKELEQGKSLYEMLFPDAGGAELAAMEESVGIITDNISKIADSWVDATDKIVDQYNRRVDEAAKALDTEVALMAAGYASNVTLKKKELDELKQQRDKALDEQQRAQKAQLIINSAMQASDLAITVAGLFKSGVKLAGIPGLLIAAAASASLFAMFKSFQNLAKQQSAVKFEKGGWIGGERHSRGGTHIEAERGEFVVRRNSAIKHKSLIEAINSDNQYEMNRIYLNKVKGQIFSGKVSLDDSKDLKAIRALMEKQGKTVEYSGSYRIEKVGNITTKIRLN